MNRRLIALVLLVLADYWTAVTLFNVITNGEDKNGLVWAALGIIFVIFTLLLRATVRVGRSMRPSARR